MASNLTGRADPLNRVLVVTGSGISAESGIPTFRGPGGHWRNFDPTQLATEAAFRRDPALVWEWYRERRAQIRSCRPNAAHKAVVQLAASARSCLVLTQNVDDLHQRATWEGRRLRADQLVQIHGNLFVTRCSRCSFRTPAAEDETGVPHCPQCDARLRPGVIWFGEQLDSDEVDRVEAFLGAGDSALVVVVGTTALFGYIVNWARTARGPAGRLIEVNPEATPLSPFADETLRLPATRAVPDLVARWLNR